MPTPNQRLAKKGKTWYIEFYAIHPETKKRQRFRRSFDLNRIKDLHDRETKAREILEQLPQMIRLGYPYEKVMDNFTWEKALPRAIAIKLRSDRNKTRVTYRSHGKIFGEYLKRKGLWKKNINSFTRVQAIEFLDELEHRRQISKTTVNNYRMSIRAILNELKERELLDRNPFSKIPKRKETEKLRRSFTEYEKRVIIGRAKDTDKMLFLAITFIYYTFIRPVELRRLKVKHLQVQKGVIKMPGEITKNKKTSQVTIPNALLDILMDYPIHTWDPDHYIFGYRMKPGPKRVGHHTMSRRHRKACRQLKAEGRLQDIEGLHLYSWKDTGAYDLMESSVPIMEIMRQLRHKQLSTTQVYLKSLKNINENVKEKARRLI